MIVSPEDEQKVQEIFGEEVTKKISSLFKAVLRHPNKRKRDFNAVTSNPIEDRDLRTTAHKLVRSAFQGNLETTTDENNVIVLSANPQRAQAGKAKWDRNAGSGRARGKLGWDELGGEYCHFSLYKENKDTMEIISFIGSTFKQHSKNFQFAGTKDRRAVTVQRCSAFRIQAERLAGLNKHLRNARVGDFKYEKHGLQLGGLQGNEFCITLRDCHFEGEEGQDTSRRLEHAKQIVSAAAQSLQTQGFINYFGLQRFGSFSTSTDSIGMKMLQNDLEGAVDLILTVSPDVLEAAQTGPEDNPAVSSDDRRRALAIHEWRTTGNTKEALNSMPRKFAAESSIIRHLGAERRGRRDNDRDFQGAMMNMQRNMRLMYVHAYQSLVWNNAAGKRIEMFGDKVVEGDLVIIENNANNGGSDEVDENGEVILQPAEHDKANEGDEFMRARPLSKDEAESGKYSVFDIVLPLPGFDVVYPSNAIGDFYKEFMGSEAGGKLDPYDMRRKWKDISLSGGYRKLLARPGANMSCDVREYSTELEQMVETDLERLTREKEGAKLGPQPDRDTEMEEGETQGEKRLAVVVKLTLGSSQYATMALRELMKAGGCKTYTADFAAAR